jgi:FkbM family methyltransferase
MIIRYGLLEKNIDITDTCLRLKQNNYIYIPAGDENRCKLFSDPLPYILKSIFIITDTSIIEYKYNYQLKIDIINNTITATSNEDIIKKLEDIQNKLQIKYGTFKEEVPEQLLVTRYLTGDEIVLELGGQIGRNSLIISSLLKNQKNHVVLEIDPVIVNMLKENRDINNLNFYIEGAALSKRKLIAKEGRTYPSDELKPNHTLVNTISWEELINKYNLNFDTLVLDCEGAFYSLLQDMPDILSNVKLIIMENDYLDINEKKFVDSILNKYGFFVEYQQHGGWGPCFKFFWQVWRKLEIKN